MCHILELKPLEYIKGNILSLIISAAMGFH